MDISCRTRTAKDRDNWRTQTDGYILQDKDSKGQRQLEDSDRRIHPAGQGQQRTDNWRTQTDGYILQDKDSKGQRQLEDSDRWIYPAGQGQQRTETIGGLRQMDTSCRTRTAKDRDNWRTQTEDISCRERTAKDRQLEDSEEYILQGKDSKGQRQLDDSDIYILQVKDSKGQKIRGLRQRDTSCRTKTQPRQQRTDN